MEKINFENGTLISKAKVEVGGIIYDVEPAQYEGTTPLSAQNLNQIQTNVENAILDVTEMLNQKKMQITELYNSGEVAISQNTENKVNLSDDWTKYDMCVVLTRGDHNHYNNTIVFKGYGRAFDIHIGSEQSGYWSSGYAYFDTNTTLKIKCENVKGWGALTLSRVLGIKF